MDEFQKHAKWKKLVTMDHPLHCSIYMERSEKANIERQMVD
jgi:hypothetical protein